MGNWKTRIHEPVMGAFSLYSKYSQPELAVEEEYVVMPREVFGHLDIEAEAYVVYDVRNEKVIYSQKAENQRPLASLSKLMTALVATKYLNEDTVITINGENLSVEGNSGLYENEQWSFDDIRDFTLVISSNDGSSALASAVEAISTEEVTFTELMNREAEELGLKQTYFLNSSGLDIDEETQSGSYGSALDVAKLMANVLLSNPEILEATTKREPSFWSLDNIEHIAPNTNSYVESTLGLLGSKTGFTDLAGGNLVIAFDAGLMQPYVIAVLGSTKDGRFADTNELHKATLRYINTQ